MSLIRLRNLHFAYKTTTGEKTSILKNLSLEIKAGELVAIQGPSGSGKSTLLYIIGCLLSSYSGKVEIGGQDISTLSDEQLAVLRNNHIGFVFQQFHLLPKATVLENVLLPSRYPSEKPHDKQGIARALQLLKELGLEERVHHFPNQLSGGQQQRVSIARALLNNTDIILADEPTGSLDTKNSQQIMEILKTPNRAGKTVIIITHDPEIAAQCGRIVHFRDGEIKEDIANPLSQNSAENEDLQFKELDDTERFRHQRSRWEILTRYFHVGRTLFPLAFESLRQNRSRSILTMLGVVIGVAAVLSMLTIGSFTKQKILESYAEMGVNTLTFTGYNNWNLRATDKVSAVFQGFDWDRDVIPLLKVFPEVIRVSPLLSAYDSKVGYGGKSVDSEARTYGVSEDGLTLLNRQIILGTGINQFHVESRSAVCVVGFEIYQRLFQNVSPLGQVISVSQRDNSFGCRVIGVLASQSSNKDWNKPNLQVFLPYKFFVGVTDPWYARMRELALQVRPGGDVELTGKKIKAFFEMKYGKSAYFNVGADSVLLAQMNKFLSLFTILLGVIAFVSLSVGGIGITNMMLVSVSERFKEIGIRKAFGATNFSIRVQYLVESLLICGIAGFVGMTLGFILYQSAIYWATKLVPKLVFEWTVDPTALILSVVSIFAVGVLSGLTPAIRAEKLQVIEALRSD